MSLLLWVFAGSSYAQFRGGLPAGGLDRTSVEGTLEAPSGTVSGTFLIVLEGAGGTLGKQMAGPGGSFSFDNVPPGMYQLHVLDGYGNSITEEMITVTQQTGASYITVKLPNVQRSAPGGSVSVAELLHKPPAKAQKEFEAAQKAYGKKDWGGCLQHLEKALTIDPKFLRAMKGKGQAYARLNDPEKVISTFQDVLKIDPKAPEAYGYIGAAYMAMGNFKEAETVAKRGLAAGDPDIRTQYVLGMSLASQQKEDAEALRLLRNSAETFPDAHLVRANILARNGDVKQAKEELAIYLPRARPELKTEIEGWLKQHGDPVE